MPVVNEPSEDGSSGAFVARDEGPVAFGVSYDVLTSATGEIVWVLRMDRPLHASWVDRIADAIAEQAAPGSIRVIGQGPLKRSLGARYPNVLVAEQDPVLDARFPVPKPKAVQPQPVTKKVELAASAALLRLARIFKLPPARFVRMGSMHVWGMPDGVRVKWPTERVQRLGFTATEEIEAKLDLSQLERIRRREAVMFEATQTETPCNTVAGTRWTRERLQQAADRGAITIASTSNAASWLEAATPLVFPYLARAAGQPKGSAERAAQLDGAVAVLAWLKTTARLDTGEDGVRTELAGLIGG